MLRRTFAMAAMLAAATVAAAGDPDTGEEYPLGIEGYSPVSYFEAGKPRKGSKDHTAVYNERRYRFTDAEQLAEFKADPGKYAPMFPNHCPYNLALGRRARIDPTNFKILNGHLLLFHRSEEMDGLKRWNQAEDEQAMLERASNQWELFDF